MVDPRVREQIEALNVRYDEAFNQNEAGAVAALFMVDAIETGPEEAASGQQEIEDRYKIFFGDPPRLAMLPSLIRSMRLAVASVLSGNGG